nr:ATP-binding protein [Planomicrobium okeanokoites]
MNLRDEDGIPGSHLIKERETDYRKGKLSGFCKKFDDIQLLILDEMGYVPFSKEGAEILFRLIIEFSEKKSLIFTSNLEFDQWNRIFIDSRLTAALVNQLIHHAYIITYTGKSYRLINALSLIN